MKVFTEYRAAQLAGQCLAAAGELLSTEIRRWRGRQRASMKQKLAPERELAEIAGMLARSAACLAAEGRKGGKDTRDRGKKMTADERRSAIAAYLRSLPASERAAVLVEAQADVLE